MPREKWPHVLSNEYHNMTAGILMCNDISFSIAVDLNEWPVPGIK